MKKHYGNMISWFSFFITIVTVVLISNEVIGINFIFIAITLAAILDMFDGKVARMFVTKEDDKIFGEITDSLCDTINFGIIPVYTFIYLFGNHIFFVIILSLYYLWAVVFRLARFSKTKPDTKITFYEGLPVTVAGPLFVMCVLLFKNIPILSYISIVILSTLMVSTIKVKKW